MEMDRRDERRDRDTPKRSPAPAGDFPRTELSDIHVAPSAPEEPMRFATEQSKRAVNVPPTRATLTLPEPGKLALEAKNAPSGASKVNPPVSVERATSSVSTKSTIAVTPCPVFTLRAEIEIQNDLSKLLRPALFTELLSCVHFPNRVMLIDPVMGALVAEIEERSGPRNKATATEWTLHNQHEKLKKK